MNENADAEVYSFKPFVTHYSFYIGDSATEADTTSLNFWNIEANARRLAITRDLLGIGTGVCDDIPIEVEIRKEAPRSDDFAVWSHVVEASIDLPTGRLAIDDCVDFRPESDPRLSSKTYRSPHITIPPGKYRVRVLYGGLNEENMIKEFGEHDEHYRLILWPAPFAEPIVLKRWEGE